MTDTATPHCIQCGNPHVEKTVRVCSWLCLHRYAIGLPARHADEVSSSRRG